MVAWLYRPRAGEVAAFERVYGSDGPWAALFGRGDGYLGTELYRGDNAYLVLDRWDSSDAHEHFQRTFGAEYSELSARSKPLHRKETKLGAFVRVR